MPLDRDISTKLGRPIRIENDANCFALSEAVDGAAAQARVVFGVILGTGVGGGIVVDKQVIAGRNKTAPVDSLHKRKCLQMQLGDNLGNEWVRSEV